MEKKIINELDNNPSLQLNISNAKKASEMMVKNLYDQIISLGYDKITAIEYIAQKLNNN